ncbi:MAG TPA: hypothetical protein VN764_05590 [Polyangiaceae bacterium]|nr:hypothetical protein [Polyangiaceae bacterium]
MKSRASEDRQLLYAVRRPWPRASERPTLWVWSRALLVGSVLGLSPDLAQAEPSNPHSGTKSTEAELGVGWLALPGAQVCSTAECVRGDGTFAFHFSGLFHFHERWAVGLGGDLGFWPTADPALSDDASASQRKLTRDYYTLSVEVRFFPWHTMASAPRPGRVTPYLGADLGFALLSDRYYSPPLDENGAVRIGEPGALLRNQGFIARAILGADVGLTRALALGLSVRAGGVWFEPRKVTAFDDQSTVTGWNFIVISTLNLKAHFDL